MLKNNTNWFKEWKTRLRVCFKSDVLYGVIIADQPCKTGSYIVIKALLSIPEHVTRANMDAVGLVPAHCACTIGLSNDITRIHQVVGAGWGEDTSEINMNLDGSMVICIIMNTPDVDPTTN
jgi:hypothetical protein